MPPLRRTRALIVQDVGDETVVYDTERNRAHALEPLAAAVWQACDGRTSPHGLARRLSREGLALDAELVELTLRRLARAHLLEEPVVTSGAPAVPSRRELLKRAAVLGGLSVLTISVPTAAMAATCLPNGACGVNSACMTSAGVRCCSGRCQQGGQTCGTGTYGGQCIP